MNSTQIGTRLLSLSRQLRGEADRWQGQTRVDLIRAAGQAFTAGRSVIAWRTTLAVGEAWLETCTDTLVAAMTLRTERLLDEAGQAAA